MIPVVVTLPLTDMSLPIVMVPEPCASVVIAGTSWAPVNFTAMSAAWASPNAVTNSATATVRWRYLLIELRPLLKVLLISRSHRSIYRSFLKHDRAEREHVHERSNN